MPSAAEDPTKNAKVLHECDKFWKENCLFMLPKVRESFRIAYQTAWIFNTYQEQFKRGKITDKELNEKGFILPGLGDFGDRTFGEYEK